MTQYTINMRLSSSGSRVHEGQNISATCEVTNHQDSSVLMYWVKKFDQVEEEIGTSNHVNEYFRKTDRYTVKTNITKPLTHFRFTLFISGKWLLSREVC